MINFPEVNVSAGAQEENYLLPRPGVDGLWSGDIVGGNSSANLAAPSYGRKTIFITLKLSKFLKLGKGYEKNFKSVSCSNCSLKLNTRTIVPSSPLRIIPVYRHFIFSVTQRCPGQR